jgi:endonuclease/exonuclease/phosphatase family metal-dependent hydrolase
MRRLSRCWLLAVLTALPIPSGCGASAEEPTGEPPAEPPPMTVMTYNIMCSLCGGETYDPWEVRLPYFGDTFARHEPDLLGIQELTPIPGEVEQLLAQAPGFGAVYFAPDEQLPYPDAMIMYRQSRFDVLEHGDYWLSPTPDTPRSNGFAKPQLPRLVVWARMRDRLADREFYFATTHFDNNSPSQAMSAPLVKERTAPFASQLPVIVVGDFNSQPRDEAFATLTGEAGGFRLVDTQSIAKSWSVVTNQTPPPAYDLAERIDHIFVAGTGVDWQAESWAVDTTLYGTKLLPASDHFAMIARLQMGSPGGT